jgi:hypothetical protein
VQGQDDLDEEDKTTVGEEPEETTPGQPIFDKDDTKQDGTAPGGPPIFDGEDDIEQAGTAPGQQIFDRNDTEQDEEQSMEQQEEVPQQHADNTRMLMFPSLPNTMSFMQKLEKTNSKKSKMMMESMMAIAVEMKKNRKIRNLSFLSMMSMAPGNTNHSSMISHLPELHHYQLEL